MKKIIAILVLALLASAVTFAQKVSTEVKSKKHLSSSILPWMRTDKPRQEGMEFCSAVHAYEIDQALTFVRDGKELSHYEK